MVEASEGFRAYGPYAENEVVQKFADVGIHYETRTERYKILGGTIFETVKDAQYWIGYVDEIPIATQGIGNYKNIFLLLGLKSYGKQSGLPKEKTEGIGFWISKKVIDLHGHKPIVGVVSSDGDKVVTKIGFKHLILEDGKISENDDVPQEVKEAMESASESGYTPVRKLYMKVTKWFMLLKN